jgi:predicted DNA-binding transcriptional regulator YafY
MIPCRVVYFDERFYLKCVDEKTLSHRTYRIDRMRKITADGKTKINADIPKPDGVQVDIFEPECFEIVTFRVKRFLLDDMIEIFGEYAVCRDDTENPDCVIVRVKIGISQSFCRWVMKYGENIEIISPANIRERFCKELEKISDIYGK